MKKTLMIAAAMTVAAAASAQVIVHDPQVRSDKEQQFTIVMDRTPSAGVHLSVESRPVTGAPYSGEAVTEAIQVLADGNRIVRRTTSKIYRDGKGRTRRETLGPDGQVTSITISDPSGGKSYLIDPGTNTVRHAGVATFSSTGAGTAVVAGGNGSVAYFMTSDSKQQAEQKAAQTGAQTGAQLDAQTAKLHAELQAAQQRQLQSHAGGVTVVGPGTWVTEHPSTGAAAPTREDLGQQVIEGVPATGTRTTTVIPAGAIGNEQPITVTAEEWTSPDLKVLVMTKHVDPRAGETTYRLTGITRGEPSPSLFELPAGVTVK